jgi:hypothetical protein
MAIFKVPLGRHMIFGRFFDDFGPLEKVNGKSWRKTWQLINEWNLLDFEVSGSFQVGIIMGTNGKGSKDLEKPPFAP